VFHWRAAGMDITSTITEVDTPHRLVWGGPAQGIEGVHVWTFDERDDGVLVRTAESFDGDPARANADLFQAALDQGLPTRLEDLKRTAENRS